MAFAFANGYGAFFNDTRSYVRGPAIAIKAVTGMDYAAEWRSRADEAAAVDKTVMSGGPVAGVKSRTTVAEITGNRSIYYGVLAFLGYVTGGFWLTIFVQALSVAVPLALWMVRGMELRPAYYFAVVGPLAILSPAGPMIAFIMPDIYAGVAILCVAVCAGYWRQLRLIDIVTLFGLMVFSALGHLSHVAILALLSVALLAWALVRRGGTAFYRTAAAGLAAVAIGLAGQFAFDKAVEHATGEKPLLLPHVTAHLIDMGPGYRYLRDNCSHEDFAVCRYLDRLPMNWVTFLGGDPRNGVFAIADLPTKRRMTAEQTRLAWKVFLYDPAGVTMGLAKDALPHRASCSR